MKGVSFVVMLSLCAVIAHAQDVSFMHVYGNTGYDYGRDIKQDTDTGYVVTGSSTSFGSSDGEAFLLKVDKYGNFLWSYNYGGQGADWGEALVVTYDSTYAIAGYTNSEGYGGFDFYLVRSAANGIPVWTKAFGGSDWDKAFALIEMPDSGYVLVGETFSFSGNKDGYVVRTDKNGDTLWTKVVGGTGEDFLKDVHLDGDSLVMCGGSSSAGNGMIDGYICKMDMDGNIGWEKYAGSPLNDHFNAIDVLGGNYALGGIRSHNYANAKKDMWHYKVTDNGGNVLYDTTYASFSSGNDGINDVRIRPGTDDVFYCGFSESWGYQVDGMPDIFIGKISYHPYFITEKTYGEAGEDNCHALDLCKDQGVVFLGDTKYYSTGGNNIVIIKLAISWTYPDQFTDLTFHDITNSVIDFGNNTSAIKVYPNPCNDVLMIDSESAAIDRITLMALDGQSAYDLPIDQKQDLSFVVPGIYILQLVVDNQVYVTKIIKN